MTTAAYLIIAVGLGISLAIVSIAWWTMELMVGTPDADRRVFGPPRTEAFRERVLEARRSEPTARAPQPEPDTNAWDLISHADVKLFLSQNIWDEVTASSSSTLIEGSAPALPDTTNDRRS